MTSQAIGRCGSFPYLCVVFRLCGASFSQRSGIGVRRSEIRGRGSTFACLPGRRRQAPPPFRQAQGPERSRRATSLRRASLGPRRIMHDESTGTNLR